MFDPASMFCTILAIVTMVMEVLKACENKNESMNKWLELAEHVKDLAAGDSKATAAPVKERLKDAIDGAFKLIKYCQQVGMFSGKVNQSISNSIMELMTLIQVEEEEGATTTSTGSAASHVSYYQPPRGGGRPTVQTEHSLVLAPSSSHSHQSSAHNSWSVHPAFAGSAASHTHCVPASSSSSSGTNAEWWEEHRLVEESLSLARAREESAMNRAKEESLASKRAKEEEEASMNRAKAESLSLARAMEESAMNRAKQESLVSKRSLSSARAEEEAAMNRAKEESITLAAMDCARKESLMSAHAKEEATMNRAKKESLASARANEEAAMNRAKKESLASAKEKAVLNRVMEESFASYVQDMVRALRVAVNNKDIIFQHQGFN